MTVDRDVRDPEVGDRPHVHDLGISTVSDSRAHDPPAIVVENVVGQYLRDGVPVAVPRSAPEALGHSACRVFQPRCLRVQFIEAGERGVEVCLVEYFAAAEQVAVDHQNDDLARFDFDAFLRSRMRCVGDDRSEVGQSVHGRDIDSGFRRDVPKGTDVRGQRIWLDCAEVAMVDIRPVRRRRRELAAVQRGVGLRNNRPRVRVGGRFAGEVAGVEFLEGSVDVVEVEHDDAPRSGSSVSISTTHEHLGAERVRRLVASREAETSEGEAVRRGSR